MCRLLCSLNVRRCLVSRQAFKQALSTVASLYATFHHEWVHETLRPLLPYRAEVAAGQHYLLEIPGPRQLIGESGF